ncbi:MAG TPA: MBL fold metallo-hydrolase [Solirubrobacterales bacterium]|nr:MBL fold metallo-hydrolase [Solirubrobacterales bacterium]
MTPTALETKLHASHPESLPFARSLDARAFLLERDEGNILVYSNTTLEAHPEVFASRGGARRHYLTHGHEAMFPSRTGAPVFVHRDDAEDARQTMRVRGTFSRRHRLDDDFEVIPIPGHTPGSTAYLWDSGEHRYLFTGDSVFLHRGEWRGALLESSDRDSYLRSLELLRGLDFDVLVPWVATGGEPYLAATDPDDAVRRIDAIIERIHEGRGG